MTTLEEQMHELRNLPSRVTEVESQILQLRADIQVEISAIRSELKSGDDESKRYSRVFYEDVLSRIAVIGEGRKRKG